MSLQPGRSRDRVVGMRGSRAARTVSSTVATLMLCACSVVASFDGLVTDVPPDGGPTLDAALDTGTADARPSSDAGHGGNADAADAADVFTATVVFSEDFEQACDDSFGSYQATLTPSGIAHGGSRSCKVCNASDNVYTVDHGPSAPTPQPGEKYHAEAWVMAAAGPDAQAGPQTAEIDLRIHNNSPFVNVQTATGASQLLGKTWQLISVDYDVTKSAPSWDVYIAAEATTGPTPLGDCFLIDDLVITRIQ